MKLVYKYREIFSISIGARDMALFWFDPWEGGSMQNKFPRLFSFVVNHDLSVRDVISSLDRSQLFHLPLSQEAYEEFQSMEIELNQFQLKPMENDVWKTV